VGIYPRPHYIPFCAPAIPAHPVCNSIWLSSYSVCSLPWLACHSLAADVYLITLLLFICPQCKAFSGLCVICQPLARAYLRFLLFISQQCKTLSVFFVICQPPVHAYLWLLLFILQQFSPCLGLAYYSLGTYAYLPASFLFIWHCCAPISGFLTIHSTLLTSISHAFVLFESAPTHQPLTLLTHSNISQPTQSTF
jgi:hypothetical protein